MVLKITNLHILRYLPTYWLYLLERYTIDNQRCTHTASVNKYSASEVTAQSHIAPVSYEDGGSDNEQEWRDDEEENDRQYVPYRRRR